MVSKDLFRETSSDEHKEAKEEKKEKNEKKTYIDGVDGANSSWIKYGIGAAVSAHDSQTPTNSVIPSPAVDKKLGGAKNKEKARKVANLESVKSNPGRTNVPGGSPFAEE